MFTIIESQATQFGFIIILLLFIVRSFGADARNLRGEGGGPSISTIVSQLVESHDTGELVSVELRELMEARGEMAAAIGLNTADSSLSSSLSSTTAMSARSTSKYAGQLDDTDQLLFVHMKESSVTSNTSSHSNRMSVR